MRREPNRMVPTYLLRELREAQRREVDGPEVKQIVRAIDAAVGFRMPLADAQRPREPRSGAEDG